MTCGVRWTTRIYQDLKRSDQANDLARVLICDATAESKSAMQKTSENRDEDPQISKIFKQDLRTTSESIKWSLTGPTVEDLTHRVELVGSIAQTTKIQSLEVWKSQISITTNHVLNELENKLKPHVFHWKGRKGSPIIECISLRSTISKHPGAYDQIQRNQTKEDTMVKKNRNLQNSKNPPGSVLCESSDGMQQN